MAKLDSTGEIFFEQRGLLSHIPSGMKFPLRIGRFERESQPCVYDRQGYNMSIGYRQAAWPFGGFSAVLRVRVFPGPILADAPGSALESQFERAKAEMLNLLPDTVVLGEASVALTDSEGLVSGRRVSFAVQGRRRGMRAALQLFRRGMWFVQHSLVHRRPARIEIADGTMALLNGLGCPRGT